MAIVESTANVKNFHRKYGTAYHIKNNAICELATGKMEGFIEYESVNSAGVKSTYYAKFIPKYAALSGTIVGLIFNPADAAINRAAEWLLCLEDENGGKDYLQFPHNGRFWEAMAKLLRNIDTKVPVSISVWNDTKAEKPKMAVCFRQNGTVVLSAFTATNPNGLPAWKKLIDGTINKMDYNEFLLNECGAFMAKMPLNNAQNQAIQSGTPQYQQLPETVTPKPTIIALESYERAIAVLGGNEKLVFIAKNPSKTNPENTRLDYELEGQRYAFQVPNHEVEDIIQNLRYLPF